jgi:hypothetical protein
MISMLCCSRVDAWVCLGNVSGLFCYGGKVELTMGAWKTV